eukprot:1740890-Amphidinium_carterae.1
MLAVPKETVHICDMVTTGNIQDLLDQDSRGNSSNIFDTHCERNEIAADDSTRDISLDNSTVGHMHRIGELRHWQAE